ncbi:MAG TPA: hypothetical protein VGF30_00270 [Bacteroidia bacterium]
MIWLVLSFILALLPLSFQFYIVRNYSMPASDKMYHKLLITLIQANDHKPVTTHTNVINSNLLGYPQLLHWIISFFPIRNLEKYDKLIPIIMTVLNLCGFYLSAFFFMYHFKTENPGRFLLIATVIYVSIPFHYNLANAKNVGLSARGLGLFFGILTSLLTAMYVSGYGWLYYGLAALTGTLILMSSQFATQFYVLVFPFIGLYMWRWEPAVLPLISALIYILVLPKMALASFRSQGQHKKLYFQYLADRFILKHRYSMWRDLVYDIPRRLYHYYLSEGKSVKKLIMHTIRWSYVRNNSFVVLVLEFALLLVFLVFGLFKYNQGVFENPYSIQIMACATVFFLTTFRKTRFIGEPERYLEYAAPFLAVVSAVILPLNVVAIVVLFSVLVILISMPPRSKQKSVATQSSGEVYNADFETIRQYILKHADTARLLCVYMQDTKYMLDINIKQYYFIVNAETSDGFHFNKIYPENFLYITEAAVPELINYYKLNYLLLNKKIEQKYNVETIKNRVTGNVQAELENDTYCLYRVQHN